MRRLCAIQVICALLAWFYGTKLALVNYPGAYSIMEDGPFRTKTDCEEARQRDQDMADMTGAKLEFTKCYERQPA